MRQGRFKTKELSPTSLAIDTKLRQQDTRQHHKWKMTLLGQLKTGNSVLKVMKNVNKGYFPNNNFLWYTRALKSNI